MTSIKMPHNPTRWKNNFISGTDDNFTDDVIRSLLMQQHTNKKPPSTEKNNNMSMLQNCDLPPPNKVYPGGTETEKLELFKALRMSQTRAREAEMKQVSLVKERDDLLSVMWGEWMRGFGYRQLVWLLELEVESLHVEKDPAATEEGGGGLGWVVAVALIAGFGIAFGCCRFLLI